MLYIVHVSVDLITDRQVNDAYIYTRTHPRNRGQSERG